MHTACKHWQRKLWVTLIKDWVKSTEVKNRESAFTSSYFLYFWNINSNWSCKLYSHNIRIDGFLCKLTHFFSTTVPNILLLPLASQSIRLSYTPTVAARCFWYSNNWVMSTCTFFTEPSCHLNWTMAFCKSHCTQDIMINFHPICMKGKPCRSSGYFYM